MAASPSTLKPTEFVVGAPSSQRNTMSKSLPPATLPFRQSKLEPVFFTIEVTVFKWLEFSSPTSPQVEFRAESKVCPIIRRPSEERSPRPGHRSHTAIANLESTFSWSSARWRRPENYATCPAWATLARCAPWLDPHCTFQSGLFKKRCLPLPSLSVNGISR